MNGKKSKTFQGSAEDDIISGDVGNDELIGLAGNDVLLGGRGNDRLIAGQDNDILYGGEGQDHFIIRNLNSGADIITTIMDFNESDKINLNEFESITSFEGIDKKTVELNDGIYTMIQATDSHQILIKGVTADQLTHEMFIGAASNKAPTMIDANP